MLENRESVVAGKIIDETCDIRIWSGSCEHPQSDSNGDKYLCDYCVKIGGIDHVVERAAMPYVSGDYSKLS